MATLCGFSFCLNGPIKNSPAGTTTISGQSVAHSLKPSPGLRACSALASRT